MAVKKPVNTSATIANKVVEDLGPKILQTIRLGVECVVATVESETAYEFFWQDDLSDSGIGWDIFKLIGDYLTEHVVIETKLTLVE